MSGVKFKDLNEFLSKHSAKNSGGGEITHTRIASKELSIFGGSYVIPKEDLPHFYELYYKAVFLDERNEYLTEKQMATGPIAIDFDFRYNYDVDQRKHTKEHIQDIIALIYLETIKEFFLFQENKPFSIYVFEKPDVNRLADGSLTKDGIHIIIGIKMDHIMQTMLREKVLKIIPDICDLPLINTWDSVLDEGISKGTTNWQLYGSRKPGNQAYQLTQYYEVSYDPVDSEFMMLERKITDFNMEKDFRKLSVQYDEHPEFEINPKIETEYISRKNGSKNSVIKQKKANSKTKLRLLTSEEEEYKDDCEIAIENIVDKTTLNKAVQIMLNSFNINEYELKELHEYTQILPEKYYEPGSHLLNTQVAFALKHTDNRLFLSWVALRSKASDFDYDSISDLFTRWNKHFKERQNGITKKSIIYWAKQDAYEKYTRVREKTVTHFLNESLTSPTEFDFAMVLYQMFKDKYVCSSITNKSWFVFKNHRWIPDLGQSLRLAISVEMYAEYTKKTESLTQEMLAYDVGDERYIDIQKRIKYITELSQKLKRTTDKNNIMREAAEIFYDKLFISNMDTNKYLLCFSNGVIDFEKKIFRDGYPQDYITKSTNIPYIPYDQEKYSEEINYINTFMQQLFPVKSLNKYMWEHLASVLIGENMNQTFNIYRGSGSNGKSLLVEFMSQALGEYKGTVPITLVTKDRNAIGGTSSEIMQLKGIRYAVMQEPTKGTKLYDGVFKELTGGDPIQGRALYHDMETFTLQCTLAVCTNVLFEIDSNDDGTWRRIRLCEFMSKFVDPGTPEDPDNPYQFQKDKNLKDKLPKYVPIFASMLVKIAFETNGNVEDCDIVMASSNKYRQGQDHISAFVDEMVRKKEGKKIKKSELCEQFKLWFQEQQGSRKMPKGVELCEYMDKKFGKCKISGWQNVEIIYPENEDEINEMY